MNKLLKISFIFIIALFISCDQEEPDYRLDSSFVSFSLEDSTPTPISKDGTVTVEKTIVASQKSSQDRTVEINVSEQTSLLASYDVPTSVVIPANQNTVNFPITVTDNDDLGFIPQSLVLEIEDQLHLNMNNGKVLVSNFVEECLDTFVTLTFEFDDWAEECYWDLYDLNGSSPTIIASGGQNGEYDALDNESFTTDLCLASGNYGIQVFDSYGDGGTTFTVSIGDVELVSVTVPGGNPPNQPTNITAQFTVE